MPGPTDHSVLHEESHGDRAVELLLSQDRQRPRLVAFVRALMAGAQRLEDDLFELLVSMDLDVATGPFLDRLGAWVDEPRGALSDEAYRQVVQLKLFALWCRSSTDDLITIAQIGTAPSTVTHWPLYPAGGALEVLTDDGLSEARVARVARFLEAARPAGVALHAYHAPVAGFGFDDDTDALGWDEGVWAEEF